MDYDKTEIPRSYDAARGYSADVLARWLDLISAHVPVDAIAGIIDLGCGTGRYSGPLAGRFDARVLGIDPSQKMLAAAKENTVDDRVSFRHGPGETLPADDAAADMVFMSMVFHHLPEPERTAGECRRVLRPDGYLCLRNSTVDETCSFPYVDFFPGVRAVIEARLISRARIRTVLEAAGFRTARHDIVAHQMSPDWSSFADKMALRADSMLARLPDDAFHEGIAALRAHAGRADPREPVMVNVDFFVFRRAAD